MTSEWRHVPPIWTNKKGLQETPPRAQFLSYDQLSYSIWRRISRATKLLSRIFQILKIPRKNIIKNPQNFIFLKHFPLKTKFSKKARNLLDGNGWWICVYNFKSISSKIAELWHKTCLKQPNFFIFDIFIFWTILIFQKVFLGHFSCSLRKVDLKTCIAVYITFFLGGWPFLPDDLRWPWPVICSIWMLKTAWDGHREPPYQISTHSYNGAERNRNLYTNSPRAYSISSA